MRFKPHLLQMGVTRTLYPILLGLLKKININDTQKASCETNVFHMTLYILRTGGAVFQLSSPCNLQHTVPTGLFLMTLLYDFIKIISTIFIRNSHKMILIKIISFHFIFLTFLYTISVKFSCSPMIFSIQIMSYHLPNL